MNGTEYTVHALARMAPKGLSYQDNGRFYSRGIPPSVVQDVIDYGRIGPGNSVNEVARLRDGIKVITNPEGTRVIAVYPRKER